MNAKSYLTISAILAILYGLSFELFPRQVTEMFGVTPEAHITLNLRFFGAALLGLGVTQWLAKDFVDWAAVRGVLIGAVVGDIMIGLVNLWGTFRGLVNGLAWSSTVLVVLLLVGALYCLMNPPPSRA
jgi:uncharacterized protein YjeT (DUF2065 family)